MIGRGAAATSGKPASASRRRPAIIESRVAEYASAVVARAFNAAFEDYVVRLAFTPQAFERRLRGENLDPHASSIYWRGTDPAGILLVARRGWTCRVAAMAVAPAFRGQGLGRRMLTMAIEEAGKRGDRRMLLEVLENNPAARALYESCGFAVRRRLIGFTLPAGTQPSSAAAGLTDVDPFRVAGLLARDSIRDWPWNLSPQTLAALTPPSRALALADDAFAAVSETDAETIRVNALFVPGPRRRQGHGSRLLRALAGAFPTQAFAFTPLIPEGLADGWFLKNGWARHPLVQLEMERALR